MGKTRLELNQNRNNVSFGQRNVTDYAWLKTNLEQSGEKTIVPDLSHFGCNLEICFHKH